MSRHKFATTIRINGKTISEISKETGICAVTLYLRVKKCPNIKYDQLIIPVGCYPRVNPRCKYLTVNGEKKNYSEWARVTGMGMSAIGCWVNKEGKKYAIKRIKAILAGVPYKPRPNPRMKKLKVNGKVMTCPECARLVGMSNQWINWLVQHRGEKATVKYIENKLKGR